MPNLAGVWQPGAPCDRLEQALDEQLRWIRIPHRPLAEHRHAVNGFVACHVDNGILENGPQPARSGDLTLFIDGDIVNLPELARKHRSWLPSQHLAAPALCLALVERFGVLAAVRQLNGLFCLVVHDAARERLTLVSDRYGYRPLFFRHDRGRLVFGTELKAVAALIEHRQIDAAGTLESFLFGAHVKDRTWLDGCRRLEPATVLEVDAAGLTDHKYWRYRYTEGTVSAERQSYYTRFAVLLDRAVERCMRTSAHRIGMFLSGGYDSRTVAASIRPEHLPIPALTFGAAESRDMRYAAVLAQRLGLDHVPVTDDEQHLYRNCREIVWRTEGMTLFSHTTSIRHHEVIKAHMDIVLTGFLGEFSGSHTWPGLLMARGRRAAREQVYERMVGGRLVGAKRVFNAAFFERTLDEVRRGFERSFDALENEHPIDLADAWNLTYLQPRSTGQASSVDRHVLEMRAPHMDTELVDFLLTIPASARLEQRVYKKMIAYAYPSIRDVPCTNSGKPIDPLFAREYAAMTARYLARRAAAPVQRRLGIRQGLGRESRDLGEMFRSEPQLVTELLKPMLDAGIFAADIFDTAGIRAVIREHYEDSASHEDLLAKLISWGLAAKYFLARDLRDAPASLYAG